MLQDWDAALARLRAARRGAARTRARRSPSCGRCRPSPRRARSCAPAPTTASTCARWSSRIFKREGDTRPEEELRAEAIEVAARRAREEEPFVFAGLPSALCGADDDVVLWGPGTEHDWELELAVVLGRGGRDISEADAMEPRRGLHDLQRRQHARRHVPARLPDDGLPDDQDAARRSSRPARTSSRPSSCRTTASCASR